jgi:hypothetical protein
VAGKRKAKDPVFGKTWVHVFEEDTADGAVYRSEDDAIPLSRRPRERLQISPDGSARIFVPAPDDRLTEQRATWREDGGALVVRAGEDGPELRIVERTPSRLVVKMHGGGRAR